MFFTASILAAVNSKEYMMLEARQSSLLCKAAMQTLSKTQKFNMRGFESRHKALRTRL